MIITVSGFQLKWNEVNRNLVTWERRFSGVLHRRYTKQLRGFPRDKSVVCREIWPQAKYHRLLSIRRGGQFLYILHGFISENISKQPVLLSQIPQEHEEKIKKTLTTKWNLVRYPCTFYDFVSLDCHSSALLLDFFFVKSSLVLYSFPPSFKCSWNFCLFSISEDKIYITLF